VKTNVNKTSEKGVLQLKNEIKNVNNLFFKPKWILVFSFFMIVIFILGYLYRGFRNSNIDSVSEEPPAVDSVSQSGMNDVFEKEIVKSISNVNTDTKEIISLISQYLEKDFNGKLYFALDKFLDEKQYDINCINSISNSTITPNSSWSQKIVDKFRKQVVVSACKNNETGEFVAILFEEPGKFVTPKLLWLDNNLNMLSTTELEEVFYTNEMCGNIESWTVNNNIKLMCMSDVVGDSSNSYYAVDIGGSEKRLLFQKWTGQTENWKYKLEVDKN